MFGFRGALPYIGVLTFILPAVSSLGNEYCSYSLGWVDSLAELQGFGEGIPGFEADNLDLEVGSLGNLDFEGDSPDWEEGSLGNPNSDEDVPGFEEDSLDFEEDILDSEAGTLDSAGDIPDSVVGNPDCHKDWAPVAAVYFPL